MKTNIQKMKLQNARRRLSGEAFRHVDGTQSQMQANNFRQYTCGSKKQDGQEIPSRMLFRDLMRVLAGDRADGMPAVVGHGAINSRGHQ